VFHHYDCAGVDEPTDRIAERLWEFCLAAVGGSAQSASPGSTRAKSTMK
jgi:hypothetical protein